MVVAISSLVETYPYKCKNFLLQVCESLKLSTKGTVKLLQERIATHVEDKPDLEEKVRNMATQLKQAEAKKPHGASASSTPVSTQAARSSISLSPLPQTQLLFSQEEEGNKVEKVVDEKVIGDDDVNIDKNASDASGVTISGSDDDDDEDDEDYEEALVKVKDLLTRPGEQNDMHKELDDMYKDIHNITVNGIEVLNDEAGEAGVEKTGDAPENDAGESVKEKTDLEKRFAFFLEKSIATVASKDHQIELMDNSIRALVTTCGVILKNHEKDKKELIESMKTLANAVEAKVTSIEKLCQESQGIAESLRQDMGQLQQKVDSILTKLDENQSNLTREIDATKQLINALPAHQPTRQQPSTAAAGPPPPLLLPPSSATASDGWPPPPPPPPHPAPPRPLVHHPPNSQKD